MPTAKPAGKPELSARNSQPGTSIWVLENQEPKRLRITTGISDGTYTEVLSGNLKEGQEVILESLSKMKKSETPQRPNPGFIR
jgi:HlyD family secretion protein